MTIIIPVAIMHVYIITNCNTVFAVTMVYIHNNMYMYSVPFIYHIAVA